MVGILGLVGPLRGVADLMRSQAEDAGAAALSGAVAQRAARTPPALLMRPEVTAELERHSQSIWRGLDILPANLLFAAQDIVSTIGVVLAISTLSPTAALLTLLALLPSAVGGRLLARHVTTFMRRVGWTGGGWSSRAASPSCWPGPVLGSPSCSATSWPSNAPQPTRTPKVLNRPTAPLLSHLGTGHPQGQRRNTLWACFQMNLSRPPR